MAWARNGTSTLGSANATCEITGLTSKKFNIILNHKFYVGSTWDDTLTFNDDTGSNYAMRYSFDGGADGTSTSRANILTGYNAGVANDEFVIGYFSDITGKETLSILFAVNRNTAGSSTAPVRTEKVAKWTSAGVTSIETDVTTGDTFDTNTNLTAIGTD